MMEMDADAAATASNEEEDGHLLRGGSDKGGMDSSQDKKKEEKSTAVPVPDKTEKDANQLTEPVKDPDSIVKETLNAKECSNNGNQNKQTDGSHSKTSGIEDKGVLSSTNPHKTVDKPSKEQKSDGAAESAKPLLQPNSGSSKSALPLSKPISAPSSTVPATLLKPSSEIRTATTKDSITAAVSDVATAPASNSASTGAIRKTTSNLPASSSQTASSSSGLFKSSVTTTTHPVKAVVSSSSTGSGNTTSFAAKPQGGNVGPSLGFQHKTPIQAPAPCGLTAKTSEKPAVTSKTTSSLPIKPSSVQSVTPQTTSPNLFTKTSSSISSSVVSSSTSSAKQVPKLPSTGSQSSTQNLTKNPLTVTTASPSVSSTSSACVSSSSPSKPVSLPSTPPLISSKIVPPLLPVPKPTANPKFASPGPASSGSSPNTLPIKLSRNQTPSPSISSLTRQPVLPPVSKPTPPPNPRSSDRPLVQSKLSFPSTSSSLHSKSVSSHTSPSNIRQSSPAASPSISFTNNSSSSVHPSSTNAFPGSSRTPLSRPMSSTNPPRPPLISQKPTMPFQSPNSSPRPLFPQRSTFTPPRVSLPLPNPPVSSRHLPLNQSPTIHSRPYLPVRSIPPQRPLLQRDNATSSATDFSVPDVRRDCPAGPHPATPPASLVPDVLRTGSEEEDRQLERMLRPTPFGGGIPPPHMPDLCRRGRDVPLIQSRIISLPSSEADIDLLRPASAAGRTGPDVNEPTVSVLERMEDSPSIDAGNNVGGECGADESTQRLPSEQPNVLVNVEQSQGAARQDEPGGPSSSSVSLPQRSEPVSNLQRCNDDGVRKSSSSSSETKKDDVEMVLASSSSADSQPKYKKPLQKDDKNSSEESSGACALNIASGTKENENKSVKSLKTDFKKTVPAQGSRKDSVSSKGDASSDLGTDSKTNVSLEKECPGSRENFDHDDKKMDLAVVGETPQQKDSSGDTKGERMTVERAEVNKSSLVGEEENESSLMLPPPVADLPADLAKEDRTKTKKGDEGNGAAGKNMEGEGNGSTERPPVSGTPNHDSNAKAAEVVVGKSVEEDKRSVPTNIPVAKDAAQPKVSPVCDIGKSTQPKKDCNSASGGSGMISSPSLSSRVKVSDPPLKGKVDVEEEKNVSDEGAMKALPRDGKETEKKGKTDIPDKIGHSFAGKVPEHKKIPKSEDLETNKTAKSSDGSTKEKDGCPGKVNVGPIKCDKSGESRDESETKDISPNGAIKGKTGESERELGRVLRKDEKVTSGNDDAKGEGGREMRVEKDVSVEKNQSIERTKKEHPEGAGKSKTAEVSSGSSCVSKTAATILKACNAKDLSIMEEKKIKDKHKTGEGIIGVQKSVGSLIEKSGEKSSPRDNVASVEGVAIETKGSHLVKSQMLPIVATKVSTTKQGVSLEQKMNKKSTESVVTKDAKSEVFSKTNTNPSVGNPQVKNSPSSQVQIRKNSNEKETEDSKSLDNKSSDSRPIVAPQKVDLPTLPVAFDSKIGKIDLKNVIHADEQIGSSVRVDKGGEKEKSVENKTSTCKVVPLNPDRSSDFVEGDAGKIPAKSDISISKLETSLEVKDSVKVTVDKKSLENIDNNSVLGDMHFSNISHVSEKVPAKLKECVVDSKETLVDEKKRLPTAASKEQTDVKHSLTESDVCDAKRDAVSNSDHKEQSKRDKSAAKCLSGDKTLLKASTQVFNVEIETIIEDKNVRTNESSKGLSNTVPPAPVVVQKPDAAAISSLKEASVAQNKLKSNQIDSKDLAKDGKVVCASSGKTGDETSLPSKQVSVSTTNSLTSQLVEMKTAEGTNKSSKNSDDQASSIGANVDHRYENKMPVVSEAGKEKTVVPLTRDESCSLSLSKVPDVISPKCDTVNREEKLSFQVDTCKSDMNIPASAPKRDQFFDYKEKKADEEHSKDIPRSKEVETVKPKTDLTHSKEGKSDMDSAHLNEIVPSTVKISDSEVGSLVKPISPVIVHMPAKEINVKAGNVVSTLKKDILKNPRNEADACGIDEEISLGLKEVTEIAKMDENKSNFKTSSLGDKTKVESSTEEKVKPDKITKETSTSKKSSSVSMHQADENFSGGKDDSCKTENFITPETTKACLKKENATSSINSPKEGLKSPHVNPPSDTVSKTLVIEHTDVNSKESSDNCKKARTEDSKIILSKESSENVPENKNVLQLLKGSNDVNTREKAEKSKDDRENVEIVKTDSLQPVTALIKSTNKGLDSDIPPSKIPSPNKILKFSEDPKVSEEANLCLSKEINNSDSTLIIAEANKASSKLDDVAIKSSDLIPTIVSKGASEENSAISQSGSISMDEGKNESTSEKKIIQDVVEDSNAANKNSGIAEETENESKKPVMEKNILEEKKSEISVDLIGKTVSVEVSDKSTFLAVDQELKQGNETIPEIKASDSDERSKLAFNVRTGSPILTLSDTDNSDLAKSKKRGEIKQSREKSILGVTERLVVANQMRQQKQSSVEPLPKESTSPRKMPGLIEMGVAKASRRKTLAVKDEGRIKKTKTTYGQESGESGLNKSLLNSLSEQSSDGTVAKCDLVSNEQTSSIEEARKLEGISEMNAKSESSSNLNFVREQDDVMTVSVQGACNIIDLSSKPMEKDKNVSLTDTSVAENTSECQSLSLKNEITVILTDKESEMKTLNEGKLEGFSSISCPSFAENNNSPVIDNKSETKKEDSGFKFPRVKRNSGKDNKPLIESSIQPIGPTTRTRAGYKMTPSPPPVRTVQKPDEAREKNYSKGLKGVSQKDEKVMDSELKRKSIEVSTEVFVKESDPRRMDTPNVEELISLGSSSSQTPITSSKILEVIRVAGEKGRDIVKVNDVEVMREPVGTNASPLSLLRKAANVTPVFSSSLSVSTQEPRKDQSPDVKTVSECVQSEIIGPGSKFTLGNTESWEFVAKVGEVELLRESPRAPPKPAASPLTITVESPVKKGKEKPEGRKPGRPPSMPPPPKTLDYAVPPMNMLEQAFLAHQNYRNHSLEVLVGMTNRQEGSPVDVRMPPTPLGMQIGSGQVPPWQMPNEDRNHPRGRPAGMDFTGTRTPTSEMPSDGEQSSDKRKKVTKPRTAPPPKWSNQEADMLSVKVDGHPLGNWAPGDWRSMPPSSMQMWPPSFGYGHSVRPRGPMESRCSRSVSPPSHSGRDVRSLEQMPEDLSSPPLPRGRRDSPHSFRHPFVHPATSFPGGTPNFSNVSVMSYPSHSPKSASALNLAKSTASATPPSDTAMNLTMCKQMSATPPPSPALSSPNSQSPRQSSLPVNLVKSRSSSPKGPPTQNTQNYDGRGAVLPGGIVVPNLPLIFGRDYSMPTNPPTGRISHCSAEENRETEASISQVRCSSEPPRDHLQEKTRENAAFIATNFAQRMANAGMPTNFPPATRPAGNTNTADASASRSTSGEANLLPGGVVIPNLFPPVNARPGEEQWSYENMRPDLPVRSASALSQYHTEESTSKPPTPRMPTPVPVPPPPPPPAPPQTCTPPPPIPPPKTGPGRRGGRSETPPPDKYNFRVEEAHVVRSSDLGPGGGQGGNKLFACDICSGVYRRAFSLKRHYLRAHINYCHLSERDLSNCGIVVGDKMAVHTGGSGRRPYVHTTMPRNLERSGHESERAGSSAGGRRTLLRDLFRCHTCGVCFDEKKRLKSHLMEHQCGSNRPSLLRQHAATHASPVYVPKATPTPKPHSSSPTPVVFLCAYCDKRFSSAAVRRRHRKLHESSPGPHPCYLCETAEDLPDVPLGETPSFAHLEDLRSHMASIHKEVYHSCALCGERLPSILALEEHAEGHRSRRRTDASDEDEDEEDTEVARVAATPSVERSAPPENVQPSAAAQEEEEFRYTCGVCQKMFTNYVNMCRHRRLAHGAAQTKVVGRKAGTGVSSGKQGGGDSGSSSRSQSPVVVSQTGGGERGQSNRDLLDGEPSSSSSSSVPSPCPYQPSNAMSANDPETIFYTRLASNIRDNLLNYLDGKLNRQNNSDRRTKEDYDEVNYMNGEPRSEPYLSWEKYNFPKDFQQMSCWDISTQLVVRKNIKRANSAPSVEHQDEQKPAFPETLALVETSKSSDLTGDANVEEEDKKEEVPVDGEWSGLSGEWVRPRSYICCACASRFGDLWSLEDHQLARHPNVWCTHLEVEDGSVTLPGSPKLSPGTANVAVSFLGDLLCRRPLGPRGALLTAPAVPPTLNNGMESPSARCTKCSRLCPSLPDLHSHMLECGGDLAWAAWAGGSSPAAGSSRRNSRKWRPFGSRRRRQRGRRGMKRNIPSSPVKMHRARHRGTDSDSIQRMIANLPAKRATRRVIQFNEDEIKTRSQATIHSVSFPGNFVRVSGFKPSHGVKPATPTAAKRGRPPKNPVIPPPVAIEGVSILTSSPMMTASPPPSVASGTNSSIVVVKKGRGRPPGSKSKSNPASIELTLKRRIGESPTDSASPEGDRYSLVKRSRTGVSPVNQHQSSSATQNAPGEPYICKGCGAVFDNASSCERHGKKCVFRRQMPATPTGDGTRVSTSGTSRPVHSCPHCGKNFTYATPMEKHVRACGSMRKGQPIHIRRVTAPGVICRPSSVPPTPSSRMNEEEDVKKELDVLPPREPTPPPPKEPDMPQLQKEEPVASPLPKEEDIPVLTPVESEEGEDKQEIVEDDVQIEEQADVTILQETEKPEVSDNDTVVEVESSEVIEDETKFIPLEESKVEVKEDIISVESQPMMEENQSSSTELTKESQEMPVDKTVIEKSEENVFVDKEDEESLEDRLFRTTGKRLRVSSSSGQVSKKNKTEDDVTEPSEEEESQKKKPGRKSLTIAGKSKTIKGTKGSRASKGDDETTSTPEEEDKSKNEVVAPSQTEIKTEDKREEEATVPEENQQPESNESEEKEESKIPVIEEHVQERTPVAETKGKRGRKPKQVKTPAPLETVAKNAQEIPDSTLDLSSIEKDAIPSDNISPKLPETQCETVEKEPKVINTIDDAQSKLDEDRKLAEITKEDRNESVETKEEVGDSSMVVDEIVESNTEKESAVQEDSKPSEETVTEKAAHEKEDSKEMKEEEKTKEEDEEETTAAKDKKLRGTKGTKGKVSKPKKKKKKWQDVKKEVENFWCDVCQMGYSSAFNLVKHGMSQKHKWNLRLGKEKAEKEAAEANESKKEEDQSKDLSQEGKGTEDERKEEEKSGGEQSVDEKKVKENNDDEKKSGKEEDTGAEKTESLEKSTKEEDKNKIETKILKKDVGTETEGSNEVVISSDVKNRAAVKDASLEDVAPKTKEKPDSSKSKEDEPSDTTVPVDSNHKSAVSDEKMGGISSEQVKSTSEETKDKEYSSCHPEVADKPGIQADTVANITASNATDASTSSSQESASSTSVSQTNTEKSSQISKDGNQPAPANEAEGNITKASPEAVVAAAPESATVIEGTKSTSEGVQCAIWQEAPHTPAPSQEFLQPPIPQQAPSSTGYNPYEWDNMIVQPTQMQPQDGSQQHLHQTQQDGWGVYGTWDNANTDPNPPPSPGLWRYQPPTPIPWGEPQHSLSPIPRLPSYTEDPPPVTHPSPPNPSLGSILDSVNRILGEDGSGFDSTRIHAATAPEDEYGSVGLFGEGGLAELQRAMGATDEEMAMLQQLGTGPLDFVYDNNAGISSVVEGSTEVTDQTGPLPNAELVDLDNQTAAVSLVEEGPVEEAEAVTLPPVAVEASNALLTDGRTTKRKRCGPMPSKCKRFPPPNREGRSWRGGRRPALQQTSLASAHLLISQYEKKEMVCPVCNRHFLGLAALETHVAWVHKMKDAKQHILEGETAGNSAGKKSTPTASNSLRELVVGRAGAVGGVVGGVAGASSPTPSRRLPCFVCKELYSDVISLNHHIAQQHLRRRPGEAGVVPEMDGDLKSQMTSALGGLLGKALANMRSRTDTIPVPRVGGLTSTVSKSTHLNFPKLNLLGKSVDKMSTIGENVMRRSYGGPSSSDVQGEGFSRAEPSSESPEVTLFRREDGLDPSEWSSDGEDSAKGHDMDLHDEGIVPSFHHICPFCGDRFQKLSSRNKHISVVHRDPTCIDLMRIPRSLSHEGSEFDDLMSRGRKDDGDSLRDETSEESQETGRRQNHHPCPACQLSFLRHSQLEAHLKRVHNGSESQLPDTSDSMMECPICRESMNHFLKLCKHVKAKHREWSINCFTTDQHHHLILRKESPEESMVIRKKFLVKMKAFPVLRMASPTPSSKSSEEESYMDPDPKGNYLCSVCGVNFKSPQGVIRHLNLEHNSNHLEGALPMQKIFPRHTSKEYRGRTGGGSGSDIKAKAEAALRELNLSQKMKLGSVASSKGMVPHKGTMARKSSVTEASPGESPVSAGPMPARGGGRGRGSNRRGRGRRGGRVVTSSDIEKSLFDVYEFEDDEEETEEVPSQVGSADGSSRVGSECGGDDEEEEEEGVGDEDGKGPSAASIRSKRASVDSSSSEAKYSCNSCGKGYKSLTAFWKHTKGVRGACAGGGSSPRSVERGQDVVIRGCKMSGKKGKEDDEGSDAEGEVGGGRVLRRLRGSAEVVSASESPEVSQPPEPEVPKRAERGRGKGKKKAAAEEEKKPIFSAETVRTYGGKRLARQQQSEERRGRGSEEGSGGRRSMGASEAAFDALRGGGSS